MTDASFTFLHAADLHLDSPLRGLERYPGAPAQELRLATRSAFEQLVGVAIERGVRFVVIAGDVFDGDWPDFHSGLWFVARLRELVDVGIQVVLLRGNHDAASKVTRDLKLPAGVHRFSERAPETIRLEGLDVALHGQSYPTAAVTENLAHDYPERVDGAFNIGVLHTSLGGYAAHERYAPCTIADLSAKGYDYWALGHVHTREVVSEDPWIVFPGNLQGRHARETGPKGATLVSVEDGAVAGVEHIDCDTARWDVVSVGLTGVETEEDALARTSQALRDSIDAAGDRLLAARVQLAGATELDGTLRAEPERWTTEIRALANALEPSPWVEKVRIETEPPPSPGDRSGLAELAARVRGADLDPDDLAALVKECEALSKRIAQSRSTIPPLDEQALLAAVDPARRYLAALLDRTAAERTPR